MNLRRVVSTAVLGIALFGVAGCGPQGDRPELGIVTGRVTLDGEPLEGAWVVFYPDQGRCSGAVTDEQGTYELLYLRGVKGAKVGHHEVKISTEQEPSQREDDPRRMGERVPAKYNARTILEAVVKQGENTFDFALESDDRLDRPNILLIVADDLGYGDLGCYGSDDIPTPNLDALARSGARLTSFYAQPFCTPSRYSLLTGRHPNRAEGRLMVPLMRTSDEDDAKGLREDETTVAGLLQESGYRTAIIGKWHLGQENAEFLPTRVTVHAERLIFRASQSLHKLGA